MMLIRQSIIVMFLALSFNSGVFAQDALFEETMLEHPDNIMTEEQFAENYVSYAIPPDTKDAISDVTAAQLRFVSDIELARALPQIKHSFSICVALRNTIEERIGDRPGSYSVDKGWVGKYQNCLLQRKTDLDIIGNAIQSRYVSIIEGGGSEGATLLTHFIDKLSIKQSDLILLVNKELRLQKKFVVYYNTGAKDY